MNKPVLFCLVLVCIELISCRNNDNSIAGASNPAATTAVTINSTEKAASDKLVTNSDESKIIFMTASAFSGDLVSEAKKTDSKGKLLFPYCKDVRTGLEAANCLCNVAAQQQESSPDGPIYFIPNSYIKARVKFKALLQGNHATKSGVTYYNLKSATTWTTEDEDLFEDYKYKYKDAIVADKIATVPTNGESGNLVGFYASLESSISPWRKGSAWTGFTPTGTYESDAIGSISAGVYNYFWITKTEIDCLLTGLCKKGINFKRAALNKVMFACGRFAAGSYESAVEWTYSGDVESAGFGSVIITANGTVGEADAAGIQAVDDIDPHSGWAYISGNMSGMQSCAEKHHLYCVSQ